LINALISVYSIQCMSSPSYWGQVYINEIEEKLYFTFMCF